MKKKTFIKLLSCYYAIEDGTRIDLGYREGKDTLHLEIGKRRNRVIENIDAKYLYLVIYKRGDDEDTYIFSEYRKYKPQFIDGEYVMDLQLLLKEYQLNYRELDSKEFSRTKKFEKLIPCESICPYGYRVYRKYWLDIDVYYTNIDYCKNTFYIGDAEVSGVVAETFNDEADSFKLIKESCEKKTTMTLENFTEFLNDARYMNYVQISCGNATIRKEHYGYWWTYSAWLENDGEEEHVSYDIDLKNENAGLILYRMLNCTDYKKYNNLICKMKMIGIM